MGAIFFLMFLAILFLFAVFFIILSIVALIVRYILKRKGKKISTVWLAIPIITLVLGIVITSVPVGILLFFRYMNSSVAEEIVYAESGTKLYWPMGEYDSSFARFEMDGILYVDFPGKIKTDFYFDITENMRKKAVANIWLNPESSNFFNEFMTFLLTGKTTDKLSVSTVYPLENENGFILFEVCGTAGSGLYCLESEFDEIIAYYEDYLNYDTLNLFFEYSVYANKNSMMPYIDIKKSIKATDGFFEKLCEIKNNDKNKIEIPQKYIIIDDSEVPGTSVFGYDYRILYAYSNDKMAYKLICLALIEEQVYIEHESGYGYILGNPLTDEINIYAIDNIFFE